MQYGNMYRESEVAVLLHDSVISRPVVNENQAQLLPKHRVSGMDQWPRQRPLQERRILLAPWNGPRTETSDPLPSRQSFTQ